MSTPPKTKLCWNCEARVTPYDENCPYCCVYLDPLPKPKGIDSTLNTAPQPPYQKENEGESAAIASPYYTPAEEVESDAQEVQDRGRGGSLLPMALLLCGSLFLFFSLILFFFSVDGVLTLKWSREYWYLYLVIAAVLLGWGWRSLLSMEEVKNE